MPEKIKGFFDYLSQCWGALPAEIRVFGYLLASAALSEITTALTNTKTDNLLLAGLFNILLVSLKQLPARARNLSSSQ
jgi:hypothetical protein